MPQVMSCSCGYQLELPSSDATELLDAPLRCPSCGSVLSGALCSYETIGTAVLDGSGSPAAPSVASFPAATTLLAGYEILGMLGRGAMGVVYKALHVRLNRPVALKMILSGSHAGDAERRRFQTEVETIASLQHPNIVQIFEVGENDGIPFYSMELMTGGGLDRKLQSTPLSTREGAELVEKLARAMHVAHERGIIHRDLKPANILLTATGEPKITDFGLAKRLGEDPLATAVSGATQTGTAMGTPSYMAPEQAAGRTKEVGPPADVYALGAILYELMTGRPPFRGDSVLETLKLVSQEEPVLPSRIQPRLPRDLQTIGMKCLEKEPVRRYASALDLADDLRHFLNGEPIRAVPATPWEKVSKWVRRRPTAAALLVVSVLAATSLIAGGVWSHIHLRTAYAEVQKQQQQALQRLARLNVSQGMTLVDRGDPLLGLPYLMEALRLEAGDAPRAEMHRIRIAAVLRQSPHLASAYFHAGGVTGVAFTPDGRSVVTGGSDKQSCIFELATGKVTAGPLWHTGEVLCEAFSPDGRYLASGGADHAARVWDTHADKAVGEPLKHGGPVVHVDFNPDGTLLVTAGLDGVARLWEIPSGRLIATLEHGVKVLHAEFSPDGKYVVTAGDKAARLWDATTGQAFGPPLGHEGDVLFADFSPDSTRLATAGADGQARVWRVDDGREAYPPLSHAAAIVCVRFSHHGRRLATASHDGAARIWDAATGAPITDPLRHQRQVNDVSFSTDDRVVVTGSEDNAARVWDAESGRPLGPRLAHNGSVVRTMLSPDGNYILTAARSGVARLYERAASYPALTSREAPVAGPLDVKSPDGTRQAVSGDGNTLNVIDVSAGQPVGPALKLEDVTYSARFDATGRRLVTAGEGSRAWIWDVATGEKLTPALQHASVVYDASFSPDGKRVVTGSEDNTARVWDAATGAPLTPPFRHEGSVYQVCFHPEGRAVLTIGSDGAARVWDAANGEPLTPSLDGEGWAAQAVNSPDNPQLWDLPADDRPLDDLSLLVKWYSCHSIDATGGLVSLDADELRALLETLRANHPEILQIHF